MKKLIILTSVFLYCLSCSGQRKVDTMKKAVLVVSNIDKKVSAMWTISGYVILNGNNPPQYLGRKRKPIPSYIHVWNYTTK